eukprot:TRINITY_DN107650_c0_g1_i1.p1 TRINITY_DN107650_c0_g1~~TRINITY_DN107650_c0_g1_i1.p1  ORF type:complete len:258 (+),score=33.51 TRINITY_DN107650_c0_g1_i1:61-774(+)
MRVLSVLCLSAIVSGNLMPPCSEKFELQDLVERAKSFCDPNLVPLDLRPPKKISGLFWLKGLPLPDVAACFSTGRWDHATLTLHLKVWSDFLVKNALDGKGLIGAAYNGNMTYHVKFKDDSLSEADIKPSFDTHLFSEKTYEWAFGKIAEFPLIELTGTKTAGSRFARPSYFGVGDHKVLANEYEAWKVLDADLQPVEENVDIMMKLLPKKIGTREILHYSEEPCTGRKTNDGHGEL